MKRELIETRANGDMLVVDSHFDIFGQEQFEPGIITKVMRPSMEYQRLGARVATRTEALAALKNGQHDGSL